MKITIPVSIGELLDKITILTIKMKKTHNEYVIKELRALNHLAIEKDVYNKFFLELLTNVNETLWVIEDELREMEKQDLFNDKFIQLARQVYINNDKRAAIKREINEYYCSEYSEIKAYK